MIQNLIWTIGYNVIALPLAAAFQLSDRTNPSKANLTPTSPPYEKHDEFYKSFP